MKGQVNARVVLLYIVVFGVGLGAGVFVKSEVLVPRTATDTQWDNNFTEEGDHGRILDFQHALPLPKDAKNADDLSKQLDAQLKIEDLIIKGREAEYAKWTPFTPLFSGAIGAALGFFTGLLGRRPSGTAENAKSAVAKG